MTARRIPAAIRVRVEAQASYRCGYCLTSQHIVGEHLELDHLLPVAAGGSNDESNLWLACPGCNSRKADRTAAMDTLTGAFVRLFNPRQDRWADHFIWQDNGERVAGITPIGRATVAALSLNRPILMAARRLWIAAGLHPPS